MNALDLKGRHAVITGGATGIGFAIAQRMLSSGARVTIWDRDIGGMGKAVEELKKKSQTRLCRVCTWMLLVIHPLLMQPKKPLRLQK